jgi:hypothetical protein
MKHMEVIDMDPAALGTALIGLESIRRDEQLESNPTPPSGRRRHPRETLRGRFAAALVRIAEHIAPTPVKARAAGGG